MDVADRIRALREDNDKNQTQIAEILNATFEGRFVLNDTDRSI